MTYSGASVFIVFSLNGKEASEESPLKNYERENQVEKLTAV